MQAIDVAIAAPVTPHLRGNTMYQSRIMLIVAATTCIHMAYRGDPSRRISIMPMHSMNRNGRPGSSHSIYEMALSARRGLQPSISSVSSENIQHKTHSVPIMIMPTINACDIIIRAALMSFAESLILAITDDPMPNISPIPVQTMNSGATMFTAAIPSAPTPRPTNIPSITVRMELNIIPMRVGKNSALNKDPILPLPKSILSRSRLRLFILLYSRGMRENI